MGRMNLNQMDWESYDEIDELYYESISDNSNKKKKHGKFKKNDYDEELLEPQGVSTRRGEGDSYISKRRKARS
tara:strand:+ start:665 stop:883 length:219 start_codon:yes stop_codon:yes gene_type:complete